MNPTNEHDSELETTEVEAMEEVQEVEEVEVPKDKRSKEEIAKENKRSNIMYIAIAVVFVLVGLAAVIYNSNIIQKNATAATMNGENYSAVEVNFHFQNAYQTYVSQYGDYLAYIGLDTTADLKDQPCLMSDGSWYDYFLELGLDQLSAVVAITEKAVAEGYVYPDSVQTSYESNISQMEYYAPMYGYASAEAYVQAMYGATMTLDTYKELLLQSLQADAYAAEVQASFTYDDATLEAAYAADSKLYDSVDFEVVQISNAVSTIDADGNSVEITDEMNAAALAEAKAEAEAIYAQLEAGADITTLADGSTMAYYIDGAGSAYYDNVVLNWAFDDARTAGEIALIEDTASSVFYVAVFNSREREEYCPIDVRHILIMPDAATLTTEDEGYDAEVAALNEAAAAQAEALLAEFLAGDATESSFSTMAMLYSEDTGSSAYGGLYETVLKGEMVAEFEDWCFDASRQPGDTGIVETSYGHHVMYFVGTDEPLWKMVVSETLSTEAFNNWYTEITADYVPVTKDFGMKFVG